MEVSALKHAGAAGIHGRSPLLRLQSDERLVTLTRRGSHAAYEALVGRYESRLLAFCRHMLNSREDAEDVLQEVFAAAFTAMTADDRPINVRPWLYRIARNRSLNHLRRAQAIGVDSMDIHFADGGQTTADKVHKREEFRLLVGDVQTLPETQRTALLLREIDALSYDQIAEAMDTTVPSVKSLLVRARVSLAEAAEARAMTCEEVRMELGEVAEGLTRLSPPARRHVRGCDRCAGFKKQLKETNKALAAVFPVGGLLFVKKGLLTQLGIGTSAGGGAAAAGGGAAAGGAAAAGAGIGGGLLSAGASAVATKVTAGVAAAAIVTAGAVEVRHAGVQSHQAPVVASTPAVAAPVEAQAEKLVASEVAADEAAEAKAHAAALAHEYASAEKAAAEKAAAQKAASPAATGPTGVAPTAPAVALTPAATPVPQPVPAPAPAPTGTEVDGDTTILPATQTAPEPSAPPASPTGTSGPATPAPAPAPATSPTAPAPSAAPAPTPAAPPGPTGP